MCGESMSSKCVYFINVWKHYRKIKIKKSDIYIYINSTPAGFEPARAEPNSLAGCRLNHSAKVSTCVQYIIFFKNSATGNRTPGICVTGRDVTNYTIADFLLYCLCI